LPVFPEGTTLLTPELGVGGRDGRVTYFYGTLPVFSHGAKDVKSFRFFTSQLYVEGKVSQSDLVRVFGVSPISVKRAVKLYQAKGPGGFWQPRHLRGPAVLTPTVVAQAQGLLDEGSSPRDVARQLGLKYDTVQKAIRSRRLHRSVKKKMNPPTPTPR
jgi:transposase-like protein